MAEEYVGYIQIDSKTFRFLKASCRFNNHVLDLVATGAKCVLNLYGIPFHDAAKINELNSKVYGPAEVKGDPIAEGGIEVRDLWFSFIELKVRCGIYNSELNSIKISLEAEVCDSDTGRTRTVDCAVTCNLVEKLW